jgi:hypothetical protein
MEYAYRQCRVPDSGGERGLACDQLAQLPKDVLAPFNAASDNRYAAAFQD